MRADFRKEPPVSEVIGPEAPKPLRGDGCGKIKG